MSKAVGSSLSYTDHALSLTCTITNTTDCRMGLSSTTGHCVDKGSSHTNDSRNCNATYSDCYTGENGQQCSALDIHNATALFGAIFEPNLSAMAISNVKSHYAKVNLACAADKIKGKCCIPNDGLHICISEIVGKVCTRSGANHTCYVSGIDSPKQHNGEAFKAFCNKMNMLGSL